MNNRVLGFLLLATLIATTTSLEWYEQGHTAFLTEKNFYDAVNEPGTYKFVKFFTHSCRYCRMLKQVMEQLLAEQKWPIKFYDVDCTKHYDLCVKTVNAHSFPFVGVYDLSGNLEASIHGYYPVDVMRDALYDITRRQNQALKKLVPTTKVIEETKFEQKIQQIEEAEPIVDKTTVEASDNLPATTQQVSPPVEVETPKVQEDTEGSSSVTQGIKILILVFGFWMFNKQVRPFLEQAKENNNSRSRTVQISLGGSKQYTKVKGEESDWERGSLMSQTI